MHHCILRAYKTLEMFGYLQQYGVSFGRLQLRVLGDNLAHWIKHVQALALCYARFSDYNVHNVYLIIFNINIYFSFRF